MLKLRTQSRAGSFGTAGRYDDPVNSYLKMGGGNDPSPYTYDPKFTITLATNPAPLVGGVGRTQHGSFVRDPKETAYEPGPDVYRSMEALNGGHVSKFSGSLAFSMGPRSRVSPQKARALAEVLDAATDAARRKARKARRRRARANAAREPAAAHHGSSGGRVRSLMGGSRCTYARGELTPPRPLSRQHSGAPALPASVPLETLLPTADLDDAVMDMRQAIWKKICGGSRSIGSGLEE